MILGSFRIVIPRRSTIVMAKAEFSVATAPFPIFNTVASFREWRQKAYDARKSVGFVPTMGALHEGHLSLVRRSLTENDLTVMSIFVNPAQFAPHEDLASYPRTLPEDIRALAALSVSVPDPSSPELSVTRSASAVFVPTAPEMYPSGISQDVAAQKGTFVQVNGYSHQMEGKSRPTFFRGVATVVTKLFNATQPTNAYFGQKDIQQALLLRRLCKDLLLPHPDPEHVHIVPTARDPSSGLALSSRNAYLTSDGRKVAPTLYQALKAAESAWQNQGTKEECIKAAMDVFENCKTKAQSEGLDVDMRLDYVELNDALTFDVLDAQRRKNGPDSNPVILSGALWVNNTRLIDNIILDDSNRILA